MIYSQYSAEWRSAEYFPFYEGQLQNRLLFDVQTFDTRMTQSITLHGSIIRLCGVGFVEFII